MSCELGWDGSSPDIAAASFKARPAWATRASRAVAGVVHDHRDCEHAARHAHGRARLCFRGGPRGHAPRTAHDGSKARARAAVVLEGRRRWLVVAGAG